MIFLISNDFSLPEINTTEFPHQILLIRKKMELVLLESGDRIPRFSPTTYLDISLKPLIFVLIEFHILFSNLCILPVGWFLSVLTYIPGTKMDSVGKAAMFILQHYLSQ